MDNTAAIVWGPGLNRKKECELSPTTQLSLLCFLTIDTMQPAALNSCHHDLSTMASCTHKP